MFRKLLLKLIPVFGSLILFLAWVFQQTLLEDANSKLQKIYNAEAVYQTYQSTNALFNAIKTTITTNSESAEQIIRFQMYNYELGLRDMEQLLDDTTRHDIPKAPNVYSKVSTVNAMVETTQERLGKIQAGIAKNKQTIEERKSTLNAIFLVLYALGTVAVLLGSIFNLLLPSKAKGNQPETEEN